MTYHVEHYSDAVDLIEQDDGTWRADQYPKDHKTSRSSLRDDYPSRLSVLSAMRNDPSFWEAWRK